MRSLYRYVDQGGVLIPTLVSDAANDGRDNVVRFIDHLPGWWWSGWVACEHCGGLYVGVLKRDSKGERPPATLPCALCPLAAVPEAHWTAAAAVKCTECGHDWIEVIIRTMEILPTKLQCPACQSPTDQLEPWPPD